MYANNCNYYPIVSTWFHLIWYGYIIMLLYTHKMLLTSIMSRKLGNAYETWPLSYNVVFIQYFIIIADNHNHMEEFTATCNSFLKQCYVDILVYVDIMALWQYVDIMKCQHICRHNELWHYVVVYVGITLHKKSIARGPKLLTTVISRLYVITLVTLCQYHEMYFIVLYYFFYRGRLRQVNHILVSDCRYGWPICMCVAPKSTTLTTKYHTDI